MNPACELCAGACCETVVFPLPVDPPPDTVRWLGYHGEIRNRTIRVDAPCSKLDGGKCSIWSMRPQPCRDYEVGSPACKAAVKARRAPDEQQAIFRAMSG